MDEQSVKEHWKKRIGYPGAPKRYDTPVALFNDCLRYFLWLENNPYRKKRYHTYKGEQRVYYEETPRAPLLCDLCNHLKIDQETWRLWRKNRPDLFGVITRVDSAIYAEKFQGAAAGILNPNIIAQELGLASKHEHNVSGETWEEFLQGLEDDVPE